MKRGAAKITVLFLVIAVFAGPGRADRDVREFSGIEFRGLDLLSRYDIIGGVAMKSTEKGILVDMESLREALGKNLMVDESRIDISSGALVITVRERSPRYLLAVRRGEEVIPFHADERFSIVSVRSVYLTDRPLIIVNDNEIRGGAISPMVREFLIDLERMTSKHRNLFKEITQITLKNDNMLEIFLKGRNTRIIMPRERDHITALRYLISFFDGAGVYPGTLRVGKDYGVIE